MTQLNIALLVDLIPEHAATIRRQLMADPKFRAICVDYETAVVALQHWRASDDAQSVDRRAEYYQIVLGLEREIRDAITSADAEAHSRT